MVCSSPLSPFVRSVSWSAVVGRVLAAVGCVLAAVGCVLAAGGCAHTGAPEAAWAAAGPQVAAGSAEDGPPPRALSPLTSDELALRVELEKEVGALAELGPRSLAHTWNLYSATDHLARRLEIQGHRVVRLGFAVGDE